MFIVDADILIDSMRMHGPAIHFLDLHRSEISLSPFTLCEVLRGARNKAEMLDIKAKIDYRSLPMHQDIVEIGQNIIEKYYLKNGLGIIDAFVAATAMHYNLALYSRNAKHYKGVAGLKLKEPY